MSFYRIYRPQVIEEIDNVSVREQLLSLLSKDKKELPHAYLFTGPRGAGKTTAARVIAKLFNCTKPTKQGPCGTCEQCTTIASGRNLDVLEIDAASNRGIDEMRSLRDAINLAPSSAAYKVYIIDEVHMLTTEAFNALLKTLEEPPAHAVFVLATTDPQKVPATIKSRCVGFSFHRATAEELVHALKRILDVEKISIDDGALALIANSVDGSFRDGVKILEQVSFHKGTITEEIVRNLVSLSDESVQKKFLTALSTKNTKEALQIVSQLVTDGKDVKVFLVDCLRGLEFALVSSAQGNKNADLSIDMLKDLVHRFTHAYSMMKVSPIVQLPLELAIVEFCENDTPAVVHTPPVASPPKKEASVVPVTSSPPSVDVPVVPVIEEPDEHALRGLLTLEKLTEHWLDFITELKPLNQSVAGVMRSARPKSITHGIVVIEAFYPFHKDKLSESKTKDILVSVLKKLFGEKVKIEIVLGKK